ARVPHTLLAVAASLAFLGACSDEADQPASESGGVESPSPTPAPQPAPEVNSPPTSDTTPTPQLQGGDPTPATKEGATLNQSAREAADRANASLEQAREQTIQSAAQTKQSLAGANESEIGR